MGKAVRMFKYCVVKSLEMKIDLLIHIFPTLILNINRFQSQSGGGDPENLSAFAKEQSFTWNLS